MLSDPGQTSTPDHNSASVWPPLSQARRLRQSSFLRGSITRLYGSLSTLEDAISGRQPRLAFGDWLDLAERVSNPWGLDRDFLLLIHVFVSLFLSMFQRHPRLSGLWLAPRDSKWVENIFSNHCHLVELCCCRAATHPIVIEIGVISNALTDQ